MFQLLFVRGSCNENLAGRLLSEDRGVYLKVYAAIEANDELNHFHRHLHVVMTLDHHFDPCQSTFDRHFCGYFISF